MPVTNPSQLGEIDKERLATLANGYLRSYLDPDVARWVGIEPDECFGEVIAALKRPEQEYAVHCIRGIVSRIHENVLAGLEEPRLKPHEFCTDLTPRCDRCSRHFKNGGLLDMSGERSVAICLRCLTPFELQKLAAGEDLLGGEA